MRRRESIAARLGSGASGGVANIGGGPRQLFGLGLLLLLLLFVLMTFRGRVPRVIDKVFAAPPASEEVLAARRAEVAKLSNGAWHDPADGLPFAQTPGYRRLLAQFSDHAWAGNAIQDAPLFNRDLALHTPDVQRAEAVKVRGIVARHLAVKLDEPVFGTDAVWRVYLTDNDGDGGLVIDVMERPPALEEQRDTVECIAWLYRLVGWETTKGAQIEVPYLLARSLSILPEQRAVSGPFSDPAQMVVLVGILAMVAWGAIRLGTARARPRVRWRAPRLE